MNTSALFRLGQNDFIRGAWTAILGGVLFAIGTLFHGVFGSPTLDVFTIDWGQVFHDTINATIIGAEGGLSGYLAKSFLSDQNGAVLGRFGGTKKREE